MRRRHTAHRGARDCTSYAAAEHRGVRQFRTGMRVDEGHARCTGSPSTKEDAVANQNQNGGRSVALPPENRPTWSPQEQAQPLTHHDDRSWRDRNDLDEDRHASERDPRRWEGGRGSELGYVDYGERPSSYTARRYGEVRSQHVLQHSELDSPSGKSEKIGSSYRVEPMGYRSGSSGRGYAGHGLSRGTGPHRGKGPVGYRRSDERILELVCEALADDDQLDASQIEVSVSNGGVTLSGIVDDGHAKHDAEDCACSIMGVRDVRNLLRLRGEPPPLKTKTSSAGPPPLPSAGGGEPPTPPQGKKHRS